MKSVLGVKVDFLTKKEALDKISRRLDQKSGNPMLVVTAYSEFFVRAQKDSDFKKVLNHADLVLPDGVGPLAAAAYFGCINSTDSVALKLFKGGLVGVKVLRGKVGETVSGVWLFKELIKVADTKGWRVLLLGGFGDVAAQLSKQLKNRYPNLDIMSDAGEENLDLSSGSVETLFKINNFKPDLLFVAYGPVKQEKWLAKYQDKISAKVAIGVGGTFNELTGKEFPVPASWEKAGLKWLWRFVHDPGRLGRILNAFPVFPLLVFRATME